MNSSHTAILRRLMDQIIFLHQSNFRFSNLDLQVVRDHAAILDTRTFMEKKRRSQTCYANLHIWKACQIPTGDNESLVTALQDLEEVFKVPKLNLPRNVQLANFMAFLVQLLIGSVAGSSKKKLLIGKPDLFASDSHLVITELVSFYTILLDSPFQSTENYSEVQTLLSQFETLANECGRLVYSFLFSPHPPPTVKIDEILLEPIILLKNNIIQFLNSPSYIKTTPNTLQFAMSSVFIVDSFLYDLENLMNREDNSILEVKNDVEKLHQSLKHSWSFLNKHYDETEELKQIVMLAFEAEYLVNYFLCGDAPAWYLALRLPHIIHNVELVGSRLQEMVRENHDAGRLLQVGDDFGEGLSLQTGINSGMDETMVGFEDEEHKILGDLVGSGKGLKIISIIGMPGLGKTTLAKKMYNHPTVRDRFDRISFCIVSQKYKMKKLLVEILTGLDSHVKEATLTGKSEDEVGVDIHKTLKGRRYLIVVDDIWEFSPWECIKRYFPDDGNGSRILLTSRNKDVADQCNSTIHALPPLSNNQCWELLQKKVFHGESCPPELQHTGEKIAAQCNGLPLVVVVVSGILSTMENDLTAWEKVSQNLDSYIDQDGAVAKSLELSYMYLPHHLKPCFLYLGRFREDERIIVRKVVRLWIAEGFIPVDEGNRKRSEDTAKEYLKELIGKNLVMVAEENYEGEAKVCIMHDLMRDMCLKIVEDDDFLTEAHDGGSFWNHRVQRMICRSEYFPDGNGWFHPYSKYFRSLMCTGWRYPELKVGHMKVLRVLESRVFGMGIDNLVDARYLELRWLPRAIKIFSSLEFLLIVNSVLLLSSSILDAMMKLRYLRAYRIYVDDNDWNTSRTYNNLEYISTLIISSQELIRQQLKVFPYTRRLVCREDMWSDVTFDFSLFIQLESVTLTLKWTWLYRKDYLFPSTIRKLHLKECCLSQEDMRMIGALPELEVLKFYKVDIIGGKWETRDDEFQKLKYLKLDSMYKLVEWNVSSCEHFPVLRHLIIHECHMLENIPSEIGDITTLKFISITGKKCKPQLEESVNILKKQLQEEGNEDHVTIVMKVTEMEEDMVRHRGNRSRRGRGSSTSVAAYRRGVSDKYRVIAFYSKKYLNKIWAKFRCYR